jgi:Zn ribbon nucleic-acid-binding protein
MTNLKIECWFCENDEHTTGMMVSSIKSDAMICVDCVLQSMQAIMQQRPELVRMSVKFEKNPISDLMSRLFGPRQSESSEPIVEPCQCGHAKASHPKQTDTFNSCTECPCIDYRAAS